MRQILLFLSIILLSGCYSTTMTHHEIKTSVPFVDKSDGVDREEAILLAQYLIIRKGLDDRLYSLDPIEVKKRVFFIKDGQEIDFIVPPDKSFKPQTYEHWDVLFRDREGSFLRGAYPIMPFYVNLDAKTGKILKWGLKR